MRAFHELFAGREDVYGEYNLTGAEKLAAGGTKKIGLPRTITDQRLTEEHYKAHLAGERPLGVVPIRPDGTISFFAIDVDVYNGENLHKEMARLINKHDLPLCVMQSKSGGAHLYCFLHEPVKASIVMPHVSRWLKLLGLPPKTEVFPKQHAAVDPEKHKGSWINLPYFGDTRPCMGQEGDTPLTLEQFLQYAHTMEVGPFDLGARGADEPEHVADPTEKRPPCIVAMEAGGVEEGNRDNALFHYGTYAKKAFPDDWQEKLFEFNDQSVHPSLPASAVARVGQSHARQDYGYKCETFCDICDKKTCLTREFGVGDGAVAAAGDAFVVNGVVKMMVDPPIYICTINDREVKVDGKTLASQAQFQVSCLDQAGIWMPKMTSTQWQKHMAYIAEIMETAEVDPSATSMGLIQEGFMRWVKQQVKFDLKRLESGVPVYQGDEDGGLIHFQFAPFVQYYDRNYGNVKKIDSQQLIVYLSMLGVDVTSSNWTYKVSTPWFNLEDEGTSI